MTLTAGASAPEFTLKDQDGHDVVLLSYRDTSNVVLVFYPFTFTGVCEGELCALREDLSQFETANAQLLAVSCDSRFAQQRWAKQEGFTFPLLSDFWPHGKVSRAYGVFNEQIGAANRATFVIDKSGTIVDVFESPDLATPRDQSAYRAALARLG